jgi:hypothetical protein
LIEEGERPSRWVVAAAWLKPGGSLIRGNAGEGGKRPRRMRDVPELPDGAGSASGIERSTRGTGVVTPLNAKPARTWWIWAGSGASSSPCAGSRALAGNSPGW